MAPRRRCTTCGSKQWHKEPSSGLIACSEGHVLQNYRNEATDAEDMGQHALRKRALKSRRNKKEGRNKADPKLYHGARGRYLYFQCQQLLLRKQVAALTQLWELPPEFEIICRDIWALHLNLLPSPPPDEPYYAEQLAREEDGRSVDEAQKKGSRGDNKAPTPESESPGSPMAQMTEEDDDGDDQEEEEDAELDALLRENSEASSSSSGEETGKGERKGGEEEKKEKKKRARGQYAYDGPASTVVVLVVACWTLRIPALYRDFIRLIETYELPYLDPVSRQLVPASMIAHLTKHNIQTMSPYHAPSTLGLHALASRLSRAMYASHRISTPEINGAPILWRVVAEALGGTPMLYRLTKRLAQVLSMPLTLHYAPAPGLEQSRRGDVGHRKYDNVPPEVGLIGAGIVVLKMVYGLDGRVRLPSDGGDPACALPRIDEYMKVLRGLDEAESKSEAAVFDGQSSMCVADVDEGTIDDYFGFCERALLPQNNDNSYDEVLGRFFPMDDAPASAPTSGARRPERARLTATGPVGEGGLWLRPGAGHRVYSARDGGGVLPSSYAAVVTRGARWAGVSAEYLGGVVEGFERRMRP